MINKSFQHIIHSDILYEGNNESIQDSNLFPFPIKNGFEKEVDDFLEDPNPINFSIIKKDEIKSKTKDKTNSKKYKTKREVKKEEVVKKIWPKPIIYPFEKIVQIFNKKENKKYFRKIIEKVSLSNFDQKKDDIQFINKKRKRSFSLFDEDFERKYNKKLIEDKEKEKKNKTNTEIKKGRKKKDDKILGNHNKMSPDNIIKKVKSILFKSIINFLNIVIKNTKEEENSKLLKLNYKFVATMKKDKNLEYLNTKLKDLASNEISQKYSTKSDKANYNKKIVDKILQNAKDSTISFAFNLSLRDYLDLFCLKKTVKELIRNYPSENLGKNINSKIIKSSLNGLNKILEEVMDNNGNDLKYLNTFIFFLYNYESWFYIKKERNENSKKTSN